MRIEIIKQREHKTEYDFSKEWSRKSEPTSGYGFDCDEQGNVDESKLGDDGLANYRSVQTDPAFFYAGVHRYMRSWVEHAVGRCHCGRNIQLSDPLTNICSCGRAYNMGGQEVDPNPSHWEESYYGDHHDG